MTECRLSWIASRSVHNSWGRSPQIHSCSRTPPFPPGLPQGFPMVPQGLPDLRALPGLKWLPQAPQAGQPEAAHRTTTQRWTTNFCSYFPLKISGPPTVRGLVVRFGSEFSGPFGSKKLVVRFGSKFSGPLRFEI